MRRWLILGATCLACELAANSVFAQFNLATLPTKADSAAALPAQPGQRTFVAPGAADAQAQPAAQPPADAAAPDANGNGDRNRDRGDRDRGDRERGDGERGDGRGRHGHHHHHGGGVWLLWPGYPWGWNGWGYPPIIGPVTPGFPYYPQPGYGMTLPAPAPAPAPVPRIAKPADDPDSAKPKVRVTNADQKAKAGRFIAFGDSNFGKQSYLSASERYKTAAQMAPDLADAYLRQGFALVAMGQYESAAKAFRRGLRIRGDWSASGFRLDQLYGKDRLAKTAHLENLAKAVEANPLDADLLVALGMQIFFDGQQQRSEVFFTRAAELGANEDKLLDNFLARPGPAGAGKPDDPPQPGGKVVF